MKYTVFKFLILIAVFSIQVAWAQEASRITFVSKMTIKDAKEPNMQIVGNNMYIGDSYSYNFRIADISNPKMPRVLSSIDTYDYIKNLAVNGKFAYLANYGSGFKIVDIANPEKPVVVDTLDVGEVVWGVGVMGNKAYFSTDSGMRVFDVSNINKPDEVAFSSSGGLSSSFVINGKYAYMVSQYKTVIIIDIANLITDVVKGTIDNESYERAQETGLPMIKMIGYSKGISEVNDLALSKSFVYAACGSKGLQILDISNPATPTQVGSYDIQGNALSIEVVGDYAYVLDEKKGLLVFDVSIPSKPKLITSYNIPGWGELAVQGNYVYVAIGDTVTVLDCSKVGK